MTGKKNGSDSLGLANRLWTNQEPTYRRGRIGWSNIPVTKL
jgi:hypothetical protein